MPLYRSPPPVPRPVPQGVLWAFVPFMTFSFGTPFSFFYASVKRRSWPLGGAALAYGGATGLVATLLFTGHPVLVSLGALLMGVLWITGTVHSFTIRSSVFPSVTPRNRLNEHAINLARHRRALREQARALIAEDPALAAELRIGRPDLPRAFDDGGLIDVNHAPAPTIALLPGVTDEMVERIVSVRQNQGGFVSVEELAVHADLPPDLAQGIAEYVIFLR